MRRCSIHIDRSVSAAARILAACLVLVAMVAVPAAAQAPGNVVPLTAGGEIVPGQYIVVLNDNVADPRAAAQALARSHGFTVRLVYGTALKGFAAAIPERALAALARDPRVSFIEADQTVQAFAHGIPTGIDRADADATSIVVDGIDVDVINEIDDWRVDADVAILDGGIAEHPDLNIAGRTNCAAGSPFTQSCADNDGSGGNGHGTHVAGTVGAIDNDFGVVGVAPGVRLWSVKVLKDNGSGWMSWIIAGVDWAVAHTDDNDDPDIEVAYLSLGGGNSAAMCVAVDNAVAAGLTIVVSAGNVDADAANYSPANCDGSITVSALADFDGEPDGMVTDTSSYCRDDEDDTLANFSNYGVDVDIIAPGVCINSTWLNGGYNVISGTSMASPHVAGAAALLASNGGMDPDDIRAALTSSGNYDWDNGDDGDDTKEPLLDVADFVPLMVEGDAVPIVGEAPTVEWVNPLDGAEIAENAVVRIKIDASDFEDAAGSLNVVWQMDGDAGDALTYIEASTYYEVDWYTDGMGEGASHTLTAQATDFDGNESTIASVTVTVGTAPPPTTTLVSLDPLTCTMSGGKKADKHLNFHIVAFDADGGVGGATVSVTVVKVGGSTRNGEGTTDDTGEVVFGWKNAPAGDYVLTVTDVTGTDLLWDDYWPEDDPDHNISCTK